MPGNDLAAANSGAQQKDSGAKKGGATQPCQLATLTVTIVRKDGGKLNGGNNFWNDIYVESAKGKRSSAATCDKPMAIGGLEPGSYEVSARPAKGMGYSFQDPVQVTLAAGDKKAVKLELEPHELVEVRPNTGKCIRQYVNLKPKKDDASWGNEVELTAHLKKKEAGVTVYWDLELHADNGKYDGKVVNAANHRFKITTKSKTDDEGIAKAKLTLGWFGGNKVRALAALAEDVKHASARAVKSDEFEVWRKHWYQISAPKSAALPSRAKCIASFEKVFLASEEYDAKTFEATEFPDAFRPAWQFKPGTGNAKKLCVGTHNIGDFAKLYVAPSQDRSPKSHVILCDWQWDAKGNQSDWMNFTWKRGDDPDQRVVKVTMSGQANRMVGVFDPCLEKGKKVLVSGAWDQHRWDKDANGGAGAWVIEHSGKFKDADITLDSGRGESREVRVKRPTRCPGAGCPCGKGPTDLEVDRKRLITGGVYVRTAVGTYLGWAESPYHMVVILPGPSMTADDLNDVLNHEMGHLFGQTPPKADTTNQLPLHPKMYQRRGGSGTHCAEGATFTADASAPLDPTVNGQLDAQGKGGGSYSGGTCIMFGIGNAGKREFCPHCAVQIKARDLSRFG
jgi:hypothetical protein